MDVNAESRRTGLTIELSAEEWAGVREVARIVGSLAERGPSAGQPSITALLRDIAAGVVTCRRRQAGRAARQTTADRIAELRAREPGLSASQAAARLGYGESTVRAVWARLRAHQPQAEIPALVPCPACGCAMRQTRRGATLRKRGPAYVCPIDEGEVGRDDSGRRYRRAGAAHGPGVRVWELGEIDVGKGAATGDA